MRMVLYAEGPGETASLGPLAPAPNALLGASHLGPAHLLLGRALREHIGIDDAQFVAPLNDKKGRCAYGSRLLDRAILARLLTWTANAPDVTLVLVDADGRANERRRQLNEASSGRKAKHPPVVAMICAQEFEAWLLADSDAVAAVFGSAEGSVPEPEKLAPRDAKARWNVLCAGRDERALRRQVIEKLSIERLKTSCRSFEHALQDLAEACRALKPS